MDIEQWFKDKGYALKSYSEGDIFWVDLLSLKTNQVIWPKYGRGSSSKEAIERAKERYETEELGVGDSQFIVGERVFVTGGYDPQPLWLKGGEGYSGVIMAIEGTHAIIRLDNELELNSDDGQPLQDFGQGDSKPKRQTNRAEGNWLMLTLGYQGAAWVEPIRRLQVSLCDTEPNLKNIPNDGGIGIWVESHATMKHLA